MQKKTFHAIAIMITLFIASCKKNNTSDTGNNSAFSNTPMAKATYDNNNYGIYKGVFVGSSGYVIVNINNDNTLNATMKIDGVNYTFSTMQTVSQGQATSVNFVSGANSFTFTVNANGTNPAVTNLVFPGHNNAGMSITKETSLGVVGIFEGTYKENATGGDQGIWNMTIGLGGVHGMAHHTDFAYETYPLAGTESNKQINASSYLPNQGNNNGTPCNGTTLQGTVSGDNISGTFNNCWGGGTWKGTRTF
jgi:hypothetical protein